MNEAVNHLDALLANARVCPVIRQTDGVVSIFDPVMAAGVETANSEFLFVGDSLGDFLRSQTRRARVPWAAVRAPLIEQNRRLTAPVHVKALHQRMRALLLEGAGQEVDLALLIARTVALALIPTIIDGLSARNLAFIQDEQEARIVKFVAGGRLSNRRRLANFVRLQRATRIIRGEVRRRLTGQSAPRQDFLQALLPLAERLGVNRVAYLLTTVMTAASVAPEFSAACIAYAMLLHPEWHGRIAIEMAGLASDELYSMPIAKLPVTSRFIKEVMRMWPFPFVVRRRAAHDIELADLTIAEDSKYDVSAYVLHHLEDYWESPERFDPDRWLRPRQAGATGTYVPFGFPARSCVGAALGNTLLLLVCELFTKGFALELSATSTPGMSMNGIAVPTGLRGRVFCL